MKKLGIGVVVVVGLIVSLVLGFAIYANTEYTTCYGIFGSRSAAESAAQTAREAGLGAYVDHRASESAVQFQSGETGEDARQPRRTFRAIVRSERGRLGHPGNGCLEMPRFGH